MTESEKIEYAKFFIDQLARGVNPVDGSAIPDEDTVSNVRIMRCFLDVSELLGREAERVRKCEEKLARQMKPKRKPFSLTEEQRANIVLSQSPVSFTRLTEMLNAPVREEIEGKRMKKLSRRPIQRWLAALGMIEYLEWIDGTTKKLPTEAGVEIGLTVREWDNYGRIIPVICLSEQAQRFVVDNLDAMLDYGAKKPEVEGGEEPTEDGEQ